MEDKAAYFVTSTGSLMGSADTSRLDALPYYKRLWAKMNKKYKRKYIDFKPIGVAYISGGDFIIKEDDKEITKQEFEEKLNIKLKFGDETAK